MTLEERARELDEMYETAFQFRDWQTCKWIEDELDANPELKAMHQQLYSNEEDW